MGWMLLLGIPLFGLCLFGLHHLCLYLERQGLLFYRDRKPTGGGGNALLGMQSFIEPSAEHVITVNEERDEPGEDGDPDDPDSKSFTVRPSL